MAYLRVYASIKQYDEGTKKWSYVTDWVDFEDDLCPSQIVPSVEFIKNSQRSLGGTLHVDMVGKKQSLQVIFDVLDQATFDQVKEIFDTTGANSNGLEVDYFDIEPKKCVKCGQKCEGNCDEEKSTRLFHVDNISFNPLILDDGIMWRDVTIDLVEI